MKVKFEAEGGDCRDKMARMALDILSQNVYVTQVKFKHNCKKYVFKQFWKEETYRDLYPELELEFGGQS